MDVVLFVAVIVLALDIVFVTSYVSTFRGIVTAHRMQGMLLPWWAR